MNQRAHLPGKFVWFELVAADAKAAQEFFRQVLGWKVLGFPAEAPSYDMICTGDTLDTMIGGYDPRAANGRAHWRSYVSVEDVDAAARTAAGGGGQILEGPDDIPSVGRWARIADPQGAELCLFTSLNGDPPDRLTPPGGWVWNELHVPDAPNALAFYAKVLGFTHRSLDMGPAGTYHIVSRGGVDRGGVTDHLPPGTRPHWLPYVAVDDADAVAARAWDAGGKIVFPPEDVPGAGRIGVIADAVRAMLGIIKPAPMPAVT